MRAGGTAAGERPVTLPAPSNRGRRRGCWQPASAPPHPNGRRAARGRRRGEEGRPRQQLSKGRIAHVGHRCISASALRRLERSVRRQVAHFRTFFSYVRNPRRQAEALPPRDDQACDPYRHDLDHVKCEAGSECRYRAECPTGPAPPRPTNSCVPTYPGAAGTALLRPMALIQNAAAAGVSTTPTERTASQYSVMLAAQAIAVMTSVFPSKARGPQHRQAVDKVQHPRGRLGEHGQAAAIRSRSLDEDRAVSISHSPSNPTANTAPTTRPPVINH